MGMGNDKVTLHVMSDLHFEFMSPQMEDAWWAELDRHIVTDKPKAVVLAGDIEGIKTKVFIEDIFEKFVKRYAKVFYTPGNHEYFHTSIVGGNFLLKGLEAKYQGKLSVLLPGDRVEFEGHVFTGGTLWYPDCGDKIAKNSFIDYRLIHDAEPQIDVQHKAFLDTPPGDIVISHHFPSEEAIAPRWRGDDGNIFFCAFIKEKLLEWKAAGKAPKLWIHGHTHDPFDFQSVYGFRNFCNPGGYPNEGANPSFWNRIKVEI